MTEVECLGAIMNAYQPGVNDGFYGDMDAPAPKNFSPR
jgi:hypothetical protein